MAGLFLLTGWLAAGELGAGAEPPVVLNRCADCKQKQARSDCYGDPLPFGATARMGTVRFRCEGQVQEIVFAPDGRTFAAATDAHGIALYDTTTGKELRRFGEDQSFLGSIAISADGSVLGARDFTGSVHVWDLMTGKLRYSLESDEEPISTLSFAPDGRTLATGGVDEATGVTVIHLRSPQTGKVVGAICAGKGKVLAVAFSPDGQFVAAVTDRDQKLRLWSTATGKQVRRIKVRLPPEGSVRSLTFSPDGKRLALSASDGELCVFECASGKEVCQLRGLASARITRPFLDNGKVLVAVSDDDTIRWWDVATGKVMHRTPVQRDWVTCLASSPDGRILASSGGRSRMIRLWEADTGQRIDPGRGHEGWIMRIALSSDGKTLATVSRDETIRLWECATGREIRRFGITPLDGFDRMMFAPDGTMRVLEGDTKGLWLWDPQRKVVLHRFQGLNERDRPTVLSPNGRMLATATKDGVIILWDLATGRELRRLPKHKDPDLVVFVSGGSVLVTAESQPMVIHWWEAATGKELRHCSGLRGDPWTIHLSADGRTLAFWRGRSLVLGDAVTEKACREVSFDEPRRYSLSPDGRVVETSADEGSITLWEVATGRPRARLTGHRAMIEDIAWSADGKVLASGGQDTTALLWDLTRVMGEPDGMPEQLSAEKLDNLWDQLGAADATEAYRAICTLLHSPGQTVPLFRDRLSPVRAADLARVGPSIADLDSQQFAVRRKAFEDLERLGDTAEPALRKALAGHPSTERRRRIEHLLAKLKGTVPGEPLRVLRAVEVLERIGGEEAYQALKQLADGVPEARQTREAKAALERLEKLPRK
jgi:WD40 repeat protein